MNSTGSNYSISKNYAFGFGPVTSQVAFINLYYLPQNPQDWHSFHQNHGTGYNGFGAILSSKFKNQH